MTTSPGKPRAGLSIEAAAKAGNVLHRARLHSLELRLQERGGLDDLPAAQALERELDHHAGAVRPDTLGGEVFVGFHAAGDGKKDARP